MFYEGIYFRQFKYFAVYFFDIDPHFVQVAKKLNDLLGLPNLYYWIDILNGNTHDHNLKNIQLATLIQIDCQISEEQFKTLISFYYKRGIHNVVVLCPSIYELKLNPTSLHQYVVNKLNSIRSSKYWGNNGETYYRQSLPHFNRILFKMYELANRYGFQYPSVNINILYYKSIKQ